jgi:ferredoxin
VKIIVNYDRCDGQGLCADRCPEVFDLDDEDQVVVLQENPGEELRDKVEAAVRACPKAALSVG